jgi:hypothetical protein
MVRKGGKKAVREKGCKDYAQSRHVPDVIVTVMRMSV